MRKQCLDDLGNAVLALPRHEHHRHRLGVLALGRKALLALGQTSRRRLTKLDTPSLSIKGPLMSTDHTVTRTTMASACNGS
jgi:hypothetical protein